jgi:hypothetical protein
LSKIRNEIKLTHGRNFDIVTNLTSQLEENTIKNLPKFKSIMDNCTRIKKKSKYQILISKFDDIPDSLKYDLTGDRFFQFDSGVTDEKRILMFFFSSKNMDIILKANLIMADGSFWSVATNFFQILTIKIAVFGKCLPICHFLLCDKSEETYTRAFSQFLTFNKCNIKYFISYFEIVLSNAAKSVFYSKNFGCSFHFGKNIWMKLQK